MSIHNLISGVMKETHVKHHCLGFVTDMDIISLNKSSQILILWTILIHCMYTRNSTSNLTHLSFSQRLKHEMWNNLQQYLNQSNNLIHLNQSNNQGERTSKIKRTNYYFELETDRVLYSSPKKPFQCLSFT